MVMSSACQFTPQPWGLAQELRAEDPSVPDNLPELVEKANAALEKILAVVPEEDLDKGREMVAVLRSAAPVLDLPAEKASPSQAEVDAVKSLSGLL
jgi:hypothetical protein